MEAGLENSPGSGQRSFPRSYPLCLCTSALFLFLCGPSLFYKPHCGAWLPLATEFILGKTISMKITNPQGNTPDWPSAQPGPITCHQQYREMLFSYDHQVPISVHKQEAERTIVSWADALKSVHYPWFRCLTVTLWKNFGCFSRNGTN